MTNTPNVTMALFVLMLLAWAASYGWFAFIKYPTRRNRSIAAGASGVLFGFVALIAAIALLGF